MFSCQGAPYLQFPVSQGLQILVFHVPFSYRNGANCRAGASAQSGPHPLAFLVLGQKN